MDYNIYKHVAMYAMGPSNAHRYISLVQHCNCMGKVNGGVFALWIVRGVCRGVKDCIYCIVGLLGGNLTNCPDVVCRPRVVS